MQIDVIVPTFNRASVIALAIDSILNQTYKNFNIYIVDDGSTDNTSEVLKKYIENPKVHVLQKQNLGVSSARNHAINNSQNEWISFLDSDDEWLPKKLETQVQYLRENPSLRFLHSEEIWVRNGVRVNPKIKHQKSNEQIFERSLDFCLISPSTVMIKRDLILECGLFDESFTVCEDYDLWLKVLAKESIGFITEALTIKNGGHSDQLSTKFVAMDYFRIKSLANLIQTNIDDEKKQLIQNIIIRKSEILMKGYLKHQNIEAFNEIKNIVASIMLPVKH